MSKTTIPTGGLADDAVDNTKLDLTANYAFTGTVSGAGGGKILQVKQATTTTQVEASFSSETSLGLAVSITPSSSSNKILVFVQSAGCGTRGTSTYWKMTLRRDTSDILNFPAYVGINQSSEETYPSGVYLDSPSSTSSISYNCTGTRVSGSDNCYFNHTASSPNQATSTITVMEISA